MIYLPGKKNAMKFILKKLFFLYMGSNSDLYC